MIYLIGGSARSGKSKLSKILAKKLDCQYISVDDIRPAILPYIQKKELFEKFPFEAMYVNFDDNDAYFENYSAKELLKAEIQDAHSLWPGMKEFIIHKYLCNQDFIIESVPLIPELVNELKDHEVWSKIKVAYLVKTDIEKIRNGFELNDPKSDWLLRNTKKPETLDKAAVMVSEYGKYFEHEAEKYGFKVFNTENDFTETLEDASNYMID
jgi:2-phosphoglycerate kinase